MVREDILTIYTDGACIGNPGAGGYGVLMIEGGRRKELSGGYRRTTNNRMELMAAIEGLRALKGRRNVILYSDSQYVVNAVNEGWARGWQANGWKRSRGGRALNPDLWEVLLDQLDRHDVALKWVKGHSGDPGNERADALAVEAAHGDDLVADVGYDAYEAPQAFDMNPGLPGLSHLDESGGAQMVDVGSKPVTDRQAVARGRIVMRPETLDLIESNGFEKGDVLGVARIAGIMAAKNTSQLIPLCHPLPLNQVTVAFDLDRNEGAVEITATARTTAKTGVEMEALTAVSVAALTVYDMCKSADRAMRIEAIRLVRKTGGQSGDIALE